MEKLYRCATCGTDDERDFYAKVRRECKKCMSDRKRRAYPDISDRAVQSAQRWQEQNPLRFRLYCARTRAKKKKITFNITEKHLHDLWHKQGGVCYYSGIQMEAVRSGRHAFSIDRIDPSRGYEPDNIALCLSIINTMKHASTEDEFEALCVAVANNLQSRRGKE